MTFSLSKCPFKPRSKSSGRRGTKNVYHEKVEKKPRDVGEIALLMEALEESPTCRKRRRRRTRDFELPIPSFESKTAEFDLSLLDSPPEKVKQVTTSLGACTMGVAVSHSIRTVKVIDSMPDPSSVKLVAGDCGDSDDELLRSSSVFQKPPKQAENKAQSKECEEDAMSENSCAFESETESKNCESKVLESKVETAARDVTSMHVRDVASTNDPNEDDPVVKHQGGVVPMLEVATTMQCHNEVDHATNVISASYLQKQSPLELQKAPLSKDQLFLSLDHLYMHADINSVTVKDIIEALEAEFEIALDRKTRKLVKNRLTDLISRKVEPMVASRPKLVELEVCKSQENPVEHVQDAKTLDMQSLPVDPPTRTAQNSPEIDRVAKDQSSRSQKPCDEPVPKAKEALAKRLSSQNPAEAPSNKVEENSEGKPVARQVVKDTTAVAVDPTGNAVQSRLKDESTHSSGKVQTSPTLAVAVRSPKPDPKPRSRRRKVQNDDAALAQPAAAKECRKRTRKGTCPLCTTCSCINEKDSANDTFGKLSFARTELEIEKALIKRQKKLEQAVDKHESDLDLVSRELKKHRRAILKRRTTQRQDATIFDGCRFLPDVDVWDSHLENINRGIVSSVDVKKSQRKMFGVEAGGQPTLTQMMGIERPKAPTRLEPILEESTEDSVSQANDTSNLDDIEESVSKHLEDELEEPAEPVQRITWRDGKMIATDKDHQPIWSAISSGKFGSEIHGESAWDQVFTKRMLPDAVDGFDELLGLFGDESTTRSLTVQHPHRDPDDEHWLSERVNLSQLSQSAQEIAATLENKVTADVKRLSRIEAVCPNWKENVRFALHQRAEGDLSSALENIRESRAKLDKMKVEFASALQRQQTVLQLFEMSLSASLKRSNGEEISISAHFEATTDIESDAETVTEFSPLSQDETKWSSTSPRPTILLNEETVQEP